MNYTLKIEKKTEPILQKFGTKNYITKYLFWRRFAAHISAISSFKQGRLSATDTVQIVSESIFFT